jgi:tRNA(fMet)-specific endonuclease VapC
VTALLLDTSVAIPLRDGDADVRAHANALSIAPYLSILTVAELEGGVFAKPAFASARRAALDALLGRVDILPFDDPELAAYRAILEARGFARSKVLDRLIAATALANGLALATRNPKDFRDVPGLILDAW